MPAFSFRVVRINENLRNGKLDGVFDNNGNSVILIFDMRSFAIFKGDMEVFLPDIRLGYAAEIIDAVFQCNVLSVRVAGADPIHVFAQ